MKSALYIPLKPLEKFLSKARILKSSKKQNQKISAKIHKKITKNRGICIKITQLSLIK